MTRSGTLTVSLVKAPNGAMKTENAEDEIATKKIQNPYLRKNTDHIPTEYRILDYYCPEMASNCARNTRKGAEDVAKWP